MRTRNYNDGVPGSLRREIGQLLIGSLPGQTITAELRSLAREFSLGGVILFARNIEAPEQVAELAHDVQAARAGGAAVGERRSGGRARGAAEGAVHRVAADGDARAAAATRRWRAGSRRRWPRSCGPSASRSTTRRCSTSTPTRRTRSSATARWRRTRRWWRGSARPSSTSCRTTASPPAASTFPGTATRRSTRTSSCRSSSIRPTASAGSSACRSRAAITAGVAFIMTAHVLVPSLDEERPATLSPRIVQGMLREELGFEGVILSDDLEMKAIAATYSVPDAAVQAIAAGCDGLLICSGDVEVQALTLEALVHAVEDGRIPVQAARGRAQAAARAPRSGSSAQSVPAGPSASGAAAGARLRRAPPRRRRDGARRVMMKPRALRPGDRIAVVAPASPFAREEFERGEAELRRLGFEPVYADAVFERAHVLGGLARHARRRLRARLGRPVGRRADRGARRLRQRRAAAAAAPSAAGAVAEAVHRLQRQHLAPDLADLRVRRHGAARPDDRRPAGARAPRATTSGRSWPPSAARAGVELQPPGLVDAAGGRSDGAAVRRHADAARRVARDALRLHAAGGVHPVPRGRQRAAVPAPSAC